MLAPWAAILSLLEVNQAIEAWSLVYVFFSQVNLFLLTMSLVREIS